MYMRSWLFMNSMHNQNLVALVAIALTALGRLALIGLSRSTILLGRTIRVGALLWWVTSVRRRISSMLRGSIRLLLVAGITRLLAICKASRLAYSS